MYQRCPTWRASLTTRIWVANFFFHTESPSQFRFPFSLHHIQNLGPVFIYVLDNHMAHNSCEVFEALCRIICAMLLFLEIGWVALICRSRRRYCCSWIPCSPYQSRTLCKPSPEEWRALEKYQLVFPLRVHTCKLKILKLYLHIHKIQWWPDAVWAEPSRLQSSP